MERDPRFEEMREFTIPNVEILYAYFFDPDTKYAPCWKCTVLLPEKIADDMEKKGFNVKEKDFGKGPVRYIIAKRKTHTAQNKPMYPPRVYAQDGKTLWDKTQLIGNGTIVNLSVAAKYAEVSGKVHLPLYLNAVQVVDYVPFTSSPFEDTTGENKDEMPY